MDFKLSVLVFILCNSLHASLAKHAGLLAFLSNHGTDDVVKATSNYYADQLMHNVYKFGDITGSFHVFFWRWDWSLSNIQFQKVTKPYAEAKTEDDGSITLTLQKLSMDLTGDFDAHSKHRLFDDSGKLYLHVSFDAQVTLSVDPNDNVRVDKCVAQFDTPALLKYSQTYPSFLTGHVQKKMENRIRAQMLCDNMDTFLTNFTAYTVIHDPGYLVDLRLKHILSINEDGILMSLNGEVFDIEKGPLGDQNPMEAPQLPSNFTFNPNKMTSFVLSPYAISTFLLTMKRKGFMNLEFDTESLPPDERLFFATDCLTTCIGKLVPEISKRFPNQYLSYRVASHESIHVDIDEDGISFSNTGEFSFFIGNATLFNVTFDVAINAKPYVKPNTLFATADLNKYKVDNLDLDYSDVGSIPNDILEQLVHTMNKVNIVPEIQKIFAISINMAQFTAVANHDVLKRQIVHFIDVELELQKGALIAVGDFTLKIDSLGLHPHFTNSDAKNIGHKVRL